MSEHALHPEAFGDLDDMRDYIAKENAVAAAIIHLVKRGV